LSDQYRADQMRHDRSQTPPQPVVDNPVCRQSDISKAIGGLVEQDGGGVLKALRTGPLVVELGFAECLYRQPVFGAVNFARVEKPDRMGRIELSISVEIAFCKGRRNPG